MEVEQNPIDKKQLVGQDVTFCCSITGEPGPKNYEWFVSMFMTFWSNMFYYCISLYMLLKKIEEEMIKMATVYVNIN